MLVGKNADKYLLNQLQTKKSEKFVDIARKLMLIKQGRLLKKGLQIDVNDQSGIGMKKIDIKTIPEEDQFKTYADKGFNFEANKK